MARLDALLDRVTMYRLVLYVLLGLIGIAAILGYGSLLPFSPLALLLSTAFLVAVCWAANTILARIFAVPANVESAFITALILALILDPARSPDDLQLLGWAAILAMASKYLLALKNTHIFNPAAIAVVITAFALGEPASWWVGTGSMLPAVLIGGWLLVRKLRQEEMVAIFLAASLVTVCAVSLAQGLALPRELEQLLVASPLFFFATIMLTEPLTAPPTKQLRRVYAFLIGLLFIPQIHLAHLYSTPELALVVGNVFAYLVSARRKPVLKLTKKTRLSRDIVEFVFKPAQRLTFAPGQYLECTLAHPHPDSRGNRRYFTIASSPTEEALRLGVRFYQQSSSFKRALYALDGRATLLGTQIAGDFTLPADPKQKLVFIAGGVGITPFRSMLKFLVDTQQQREIILIYLNKAVEDIIYQDVLSAAEKALGLKVVYTLTDAAALPRGWSGYAGRLDEVMLQRAVPDYSGRTFFLSGPPEMVRASEHVLKVLGIPRAQIKKDFFPGLV
jgi:ferredoxin-NADP reductase/Na+-transporting NADH:ubiquinone oxidoreductase subunit NqrB